MATTRIIPMHHNKGKSVRQCFKERTDYVMNPGKTRQRELVKTYACNPKTLDAEWALTRRDYRELTQRNHPHEVIAYQVRQSFKPGEVTAEEANAIGMEFAQRFLKGQHAFVVATHVDRQHIHNHIVWNAVTLDAQSKFRNFYWSTLAVARLSDQICAEHHLSVITNPQHTGVDYGVWLGDKAKPSYRELLRMAIDTALAQKPNTFDSLLQLLQNEGWEVKQGKRISLRGKDQARFVRLDSLGDEYDEAALRAIIAGQKEHQPKKRRAITPRKDRLGLLIEIQAAVDAGKGVAFEHWADRENFKLAARSLRLLLDKGVDSWDAANSMTQEANDSQKSLLDQCHALDAQINEKHALRMHIINYIKHRAVAEGYRKSGYSRQYAEEHADELEAYRAAKKAFDEQGLAQLPKVAELQQQERELIAEKQRFYAEYRKARDEARELTTATANISKFFQENTEDMPYAHTPNQHTK